MFWKLYKLLPHNGKQYKYSGTKKSIIQNRMDISQRPKIVETKPATKIILIKTDTLASNFVASAEIRIDFSIRQDESDLLLIL